MNPPPRVRPAVLGLGVVIVFVIAGVPFLVRGQQAERGQAASVPAPAPAPTAAVMEAAEPGGEPGAIGAVHPYRAGEPVAPAELDCSAVANDENVPADQFPVPLPPFSDNVFPCTRCHDKPEDFNATKRNLTLEHLKIKLVHGPREQWCYGCHNPTDRDQLRLAGGRTVSFQQSYELCGQCHGPKLRDWRVGIHGRRTGCWNGKSEYLLCVHCHDPHAPRFRAVEPMPRPRKPSEIQPRGTP